MTIKLLADQYGLTAGQIRGLLLQCGSDPEVFAAAAAKLRNR